jgi:hypothetical protein
MSVSQAGFLGLPVFHEERSFQLDINLAILHLGSIHIADPAVEPIINLSFMGDHCWSTRITDSQKIEDGKQQFKLHNTSV